MCTWELVGWSQIKKPPVEHILTSWLHSSWSHPNASPRQSALPLSLRSMLLSPKYPRAIPYLEIDRNLPKAPGLTATSSASEVNHVSHTLLDDPVMAIRMAGDLYTAVRLVLHSVNSAQVLLLGRLMRCSLPLHRVSPGEPKDCAEIAAAITSGERGRLQ